MIFFPLAPKTDFSYSLDWSRWYFHKTRNCRCPKISKLIVVCICRLSKRAYIYIYSPYLSSCNGHDDMRGLSIAPVECAKVVIALHYNFYSQYSSFALYGFLGASLHNQSIEIRCFILALIYVSWKTRFQSCFALWLDDDDDHQWIFLHDDSVWCFVYNARLAKIIIELIMLWNVNYCEWMKK